MLLTPRGQRPGVLLGTPQCTGQPPTNNRSSHPKCQQCQGRETLNWAIISSIIPTRTLLRQAKPGTHAYRGLSQQTRTCGHPVQIRGETISTESWDRGPHFTALCGTYRTTGVHVPHQANFDPFCRLPLRTVPDMYQQSLTSTRTHTPSTWSCPKAASRNDLWRGVWQRDTQTAWLGGRNPTPIKLREPWQEGGRQEMGSLVAAPAFPFSSRKSQFQTCLGS